MQLNKEELPSLDGYATEEFVTNQGYLTEHQSLEDYPTFEDIEDTLKDYASKNYVNSKIGNIDTLLQDIDTGSGV